MTDLLKYKLVDASMEVNMLPWNLVEALMEEDGSFHGSRLKK